MLQLKLAPCLPSRTGKPDSHLVGSTMASITSDYEFDSRGLRYSAPAPWLRARPPNLPMSNTRLTRQMVGFTPVTSWKFEATGCCFWVDRTRSSTLLDR